MDFNYIWVEGRFLKRPNRFIAHIEVDGLEVIAHVPNTGRLRELLLPGTAVLLSDHLGENRKTRYELRMIWNGDCWVSIDSQLPNKIVAEGIETGFIDDFGTVPAYKREVQHGNSRFDFLVKGDPDCFVEVKGVTLFEAGWSYFPDAPTERGTRHLLELATLSEQGLKGGVVFLVQHPLAEGFTPNGRMDPKFARAVNIAYEAGVKMVAWRCTVSPMGVYLEKRIPIVLWDEDEEVSGR